jgi:AraC-like DNA-binding protein/DNA-binding NarL/FixJ family response regulator
VYTVLIVDDEPLICQGIRSLLADSGLPIDNIVTSTSGHEALDHVRMEDVDLIITDIQMPGMSGIELMHQAKMIKPWVQTVVVSAHESFQYAQMAIRLGAKDYLIKPLDHGQFLDRVRDVLLTAEKPREPAVDEGAEGGRERFRMRELKPRQIEALQGLLAGAVCEPDALKGLGIDVSGPYFSVIRLRLRIGERPLSGKEKELLRYGALNIVCELLDGEWRHYAFHSGRDEITIVLQWDLSRDPEASVSPIHQMEMLARSLHHNLQKYLGVGSVAGFSQMLAGVRYLPELNEQSCKAIEWNRGHDDHHVFYYGDLQRGPYQEEPTEEELRVRNNRIVETAKAYIDEHYAKKGLTLLEVAQQIHVSPNYLSYLFKKYTGCNLWEYVVKLRMEESRRLLMHTDMRRYEIAEKVGYESPEHFSKMFKKYFGVSPSELKK